MVLAMEAVLRNFSELEDILLLYLCFCAHASLSEQRQTAFVTIDNVPSSWYALSLIINLYNRGLAAG